jgi:cytochrome c-type biogenesis protein CcmH/NrfG
MHAVPGSRASDSRARPAGAGGTPALPGRRWAALAAAGLALVSAGCRSPNAEAGPPTTPSSARSAESPPANAGASIDYLNPKAGPASHAPPGSARTAQSPPANVGASIAYLNSQRARYPRDAGLLVALGKAYVAAGRLEDGLAAFQDAARVNPRYVPAFLGQGQLWLKLGRPAKAVEAYTEAARLLPDQSLIELELASAYTDLRDFPSAQKHAERAAKLDPKNPEIYRALGAIYSATGDLTSTTRAGQQAIALDPNDIRNWIQMGSLYVALHHQADAVPCYRKALQLDPANVDANIQLADTLNQLDQTRTTRQEIYRLLGRALTLDPYQPWALYLLGKLYLADGKLDLAVPTLRRAVRWDPESEETLLALGQALTRQGNTEEGRKILAEAQHALNNATDFRGLEYQAYTNPNPDVHLRLAEVYQRNHLYDSALYAVQRGLKLSPKDARLLALQAQLLRHPPASPH